MHLDYNGPKIEHHIKVDNHLFFDCPEKICFLLDKTAFTLYFFCVSGFFFIFSGVKNEGQIHLLLNNLSYCKFLDINKGER